MALNVSDHPGCVGGIVGNQVTAFLVFTSGRFTIHSSGVHALTTFWRLNLSANASTLNLGSGSNAVTQISAGFQVQFLVTLIDLSPFGSSVASSFSNRSAVGGNASSTFHLNRTVTMPFAVALNSGDTYKVVVELISTVWGVVHERLGPEYVSAAVNFAPNGRPSVFQGFTIS
jgi:hypothetical protein